MNMSSSVEKMLVVLKQELRAHGLRYHEVAQRLGTSEISIKRYLNGKGISIAALEKMAELVNLDLLSLAAMAARLNNSKPELTPAQQEVLGRERALAGVYFLMLRGLSPTRIAQEFELSPARIEELLARLDELAIIRRLSGRRIEVLARPNADWKNGSLLAELSRDQARSFLAEIDLDAEACEWYYYSVRVSQASTRQLQELIKTFIADVRALGRRDIGIPPSEAKWYRVFVGAQPGKESSIL